MEYLSILSSESVEKCVSLWYNILYIELGFGGALAVGGGIDGGS